MASPASDRISVLYLDDDEGNLSVFESSFLRFFDVHTASRPADALKVLQDKPVNIILTDQRMPEMTGIEFLSTIMPQHPEAIRMIVTAYTDVEVVVQAINECGIYRYITKPWNKDDLKQTLENAAEAYRLRQENRQLVDDLQRANGALAHRVDELNTLNAELTAYTLQMVQKNENIAEAKTKMQEALRQLESTRTAVQATLQSVQAAGKDDARYWDDFLIIFEKSQSGFFSRLKDRFPDLTPNELKLTALLRMNMSSKEISNILGISHHSVNVARYRLRKRMGLENDQGLETVLLSI
jgi:response regulator RpfG family c-di-GMP phosphodiesterase/DNA-binding CsgD family transcriptional regulator